MNRCSQNAPQKRPDPAYKPGRGKDITGTAPIRRSGEAMPNQIPQKRRLFRVCCAAVLTLSLMTLSVSAVRAGDDDDESALTKFMKALGLQKPGEEGISYTERSPLVVPPSRDLPRPIDAAAAPPVPDWPKDPDVKRRKEAKAKKKTQELWDFTEDARPLRPDELERGRRPSRDDGKPAGPHGDSDVGAVLSQDQLGNRKSIFSFDWLRKEEYSTFTGEPARADLTDPPAGYRTPSPDQPYGIGAERGRTKSKSIGERMETESGR